MIRKFFLFSVVLIPLIISGGCRKSAKKNSSNSASTTASRSNNNSSDRSANKGSTSRSTTVLSGQEIFKRYNNAVVMILTSDGENGFQGSGFFINDNGLAVSNYHVFKGTTVGAEQIKLANSNIAYKVEEVITSSEDDDFILFRVADCGKTDYIPIAGSRPEVGTKVFAIGSPQGLENTLSSGEVSQWRDKNLMQTSALIDHGSSGGALISEYGEVVGITSGTFAEGSQANLNYAISIEVIKPYINQR